MHLSFTVAHIIKCSDFRYDMRRTWKVYIVQLVLVLSDILQTSCIILLVIMFLSLPIA
jgi:hypothetical protein